MSINSKLEYYDKILIILEEKYQDCVTTLKELSKSKGSNIDTYEFYLREAEYLKNLKQKTLDYKKEVKNGNIR